MPSYNADLDVIKQLDAALVTFVAQQADALAAVENEIGVALQALQEQEQDRRANVERCQQELFRCYALQAVAGVDCAAESEALREAQGLLEETWRAQARAQEVIAAYHTASERLSGVLENDVPRARHFLGNRISALEAYAATTVSPAAVPAPLNGDVVAAVRSSRPALQAAAGDAGELVTVQVLSERFGLKEMPLTAPHAEWGRVFAAPGMPLVVVDSGAAENDRVPEGSASSRIAGLIADLEPQSAPVTVVVIHLSGRRADVYARSPSVGWHQVQSGLMLKRDDGVPPGPQGSEHE